MFTNLEEIKSKLSYRQLGRLDLLITELNLLAACETGDYKKVTAKAWRDSVSEKGSLYKAELHLDTGDLAAISEGLFVTPKS